VQDDDAPDANLRPREQQQLLRRRRESKILNATPVKGVVDGRASRDAACQAGGLGSTPGPGQS
jgi:hypothetical protein